MSKPSKTRVKGRAGSKQKVKRRHRYVSGRWRLVLLCSIVAIGITLFLALWLSRPHIDRVDYIKDRRPPVASSNQVSIKYIDIPSDDDTERPATASGHYLYHASIPNTFGGALLGKVVYDGKVVYEDPNAPNPANTTYRPEDFPVDPGLTLSQNGLHYGYVLNNGIYVDSKLVRKTTEGAYVQPYLLAVSNDGLSYAYISNDYGLYKNQQLLLKPGGFSRPVIKFDDNVDHYVATQEGKYYYDGQLVKSDINQPASSGINISGNGQHYVLFGANGVGQQVITGSWPNPHYGHCNVNPMFCGYKDPSSGERYLIKGYYNLSGQAELILDNKKVYTSSRRTTKTKGFELTSNTNKTGEYNQRAFEQNLSDFHGTTIVYAGVTNNGDYYYLIGSPSPYFSINGTYNYSLPSFFALNMPALDSNFAPPFTSQAYRELVGVTDAKDHYLVMNDGAGRGDKKYFNIDGKDVTLSGAVSSVELSGDTNTLFVYRVNESGHN